MAEIKSGRRKSVQKSSVRKKSPAASVCAVLCSAVCAVSIVLFSSGGESSPVYSGENALPAFSSAAPAEDSFWESFSQFTAGVFHGE